MDNKNMSEKIHGKELIRNQKQRKTETIIPVKMLKKMNKEPKN